MIVTRSRSAGGSPPTTTRRTSLARRTSCLPLPFLAAVLLALGPFPSFVVSLKLPQTSLEFVQIYGDGSGEAAAEHCYIKGDANFDHWFVQGVMLGRHTTWVKGWEVAASNGTVYGGEPPDDAEDGDWPEYYVRVYDLLRKAHKSDVMPKSVELSEVCHKGMEKALEEGGEEMKRKKRLKSKPNKFVTDDEWSDLWSECTDQLNGSKRKGSGREMKGTCIDHPGILIRNPTQLSSSNNPCGLPYRMADGAHRICLRKYLLVLLRSELRELNDELQATMEAAEGEAREGEEKKEEGDDEETHEEIIQMIHGDIENTERFIDRTSHPPYMILDHDTLVKKLSTEDPKTTWANPTGMLTMTEGVKFYAYLESVYIEMRSLGSEYGVEDDIDENEDDDSDDDDDADTGASNEEEDHVEL